MVLFLLHYGTLVILCLFVFLMVSLMLTDFPRLEALQSRFSSALHVSGILQERHSDSLRNNNPAIHPRKQACAGF